MSRLLRTNLATNPRFETTHAGITLPDGSAAYSPRAMDATGRGNAAVGSRSGGVPYVHEDGLAIVYNGSSGDSVGAYPCLRGSTDGRARARLGVALGAWAGIAVEFRYEAEPTSYIPDTIMRSLTWSRIDAAGTYRYDSLRARAPALPGVWHHLAIAAYLDPTDLDGFVTLAWGGATGVGVFRNLIICEGDTEEQALAAVTSGVAFP